MLLISLSVCVVMAGLTCCTLIAQCSTGVQPHLAPDPISLTWSRWSCHPPHTDPPGDPLPRRCTTCNLLQKKRNQNSLAGQTLSEGMSHSLEMIVRPKENNHPGKSSGRHLYLIENFLSLTIVSNFQLFVRHQQNCCRMKKEIFLQGLLKAWNPLSVVHSGPGVFVLDSPSPSPSTSPF